MSGIACRQRGGTGQIVILKANLRIGFLGVASP